MALNKILLSDNVTELTGVKSVVYKEVASADVNIHGGCVCSASIEVEVYGSQATAVSAGDVVYYYQIDKNNVQTLIGEFICEPTIKTKTSYKFIAYDNAQKLNADFSQWLQANQSNFPMTVYALVSAACAEAGVALGSSAWGLSTESVQAFYSDGITCRDILSYAAEIGCCFVRCHSDGAVYFDWFSSNANTIAPSVGTGQYAYKQDGLNYANYTTAALDRVAVHPSGEDDVAYIYPTGITSGNTLHIQNNLLLTGADAAFYNAVAQQVYTVMSALGTYRPMTASLFAKENPFRAGDIVSVTDSQSVTFTSIITGMTVSESGAILESIGHETYDEGTGNTQKAITQLASDVVRINKLKVDWADINTAIINYLTANNVTAQNLTIVDENGNVLATYDSSGITLGNSGEVHAEIDFNSFQLFDKDGNLYASIGDARNASGIVNVTDIRYADQISYSISYYYTLSPNDLSSVSVSVNGTPISASNYIVYSDWVTINYTLYPNDEVEIFYTTDEPYYQYLFGTLQSGTELGYYAFAAGKNSQSNMPYSSVGGGQQNKATNYNAVVSGGVQNTASGVSSVASGGSNNNAIGDCSVVSGGLANKAGLTGYHDKSGSYSTVGGGQYNNASGINSTIGGGQHNEATGEDSAIPGGQYLIANHKSQFVFGEFNVKDPNAISADQRGNYVEIVGNGTAISARSNARTLDWNGRETLFGGLEIDGITTNQINGIILKDTEYGFTHLPSSTIQKYFLSVQGNNAQPIAYMRGYIDSAGKTGISIYGRNVLSGSSVLNGFTLAVKADGTREVILTEAEPFLKALGLGNASGSLPITVAQGGTGATNAATAVANLGLGTLQAEKIVISNGSSGEFSVPNSSRGLLISSGSNINTKDMFLYNVTSTGGVSYVKMGTSTGLTITTATNKITIANSGGSQTQVCKISY